MTNTIPPTSEKEYLTGRTALNIPYEDGTFADWHFSEVFLSGRGGFHRAGKEVPDTSEILGSYGIRECSDVLRRFGVPVEEGKKVYAANHIRAILDLVLRSIQKHKLPAHIYAPDMLDDTESMQELQKQIYRVKQSIQDTIALSLLETWETQQH